MMVRADRKVSSDRPPPVYASVKNRMRRGFKFAVVVAPEKYLHRAERERRRAHARA
jgi:hypothetical protein